MVNPNIKTENNIEIPQHRPRSIKRLPSMQIYECLYCGNRVLGYDLSEAKLILFKLGACMPA